MGLSLIAGVGIAIAVSVGPAREWRGALHVPAAMTEPADGSEILKCEVGVLGSITLHQTVTEVIRERVPLADQLMKKPSAGSGGGPANHVVSVPRIKKPEAVKGSALPLVVITPPPEPEKKLAIPTNTSPVVPNITQKTEQPQIKVDGPSEIAPARRQSVVTTPGANGWNTVEITTTGFAAANPGRAAAIDTQRGVKEAPLLGKPQVVAYVGLDPRDQDSSMTPTKTTAIMQVHDSQMHLFEAAAKTQERIATAQRDMQGGNSATMRSVFRDIADAEAAAGMTRVYRGGCQTGCCDNQRSCAVSVNPGAIDPRLVRDEKADAAAAQLSSLKGVERFQELLSRGNTESAIEYLNDYLRQSPDDGRAHAVLGLRELTNKKTEQALKHLARSCELGACAFSEPLTLSAWGISPSALADSLARLMMQKQQNKGSTEAKAMAAAAYAIGHADAAGRLIHAAVSLGMERTEAATLEALWQARK